MKKVHPHVEYDENGKQCAVFLSAKITCPSCEKKAIEQTPSTKDERNFKCESCGIEFILKRKANTILSSNSKIMIEFFDVEIQ